MPALPADAVRTTHSAPIRGDYRTGVVLCCGRLLRDLPPGDALVVDADTPTCGRDPNPPRRTP